MKKHIFLTLFSAFTLTLFAQPEGGPEDFREKKDKMNAMRSAYITTELNLSTEEAQTFWPVYNELDSKIEAMRMANYDQAMKLRKSGKKIEDFSDQELLDMMKARLDNDEQIAKLRKQYHEKFLKLLGVKKTAMLYHAEMEFTRDLMRKSKGGRPGPGPGPGGKDR